MDGAESQPNSSNLPPIMPKPLLGDAGESRCPMDIGSESTSVLMIIAVTSIPKTDLEFSCPYCGTDLQLLDSCRKGLKAEIQGQLRSHSRQPSSEITTLGATFTTIWRGHTIIGIKIQEFMVFDQIIISNLDDLQMGYTRMAFGQLEEFLEQRGLNQPISKLQMDGQTGDHQLYDHLQAHLEQYLQVWNQRSCDRARMPSTLGTCGPIKGKGILRVEITPILNKRPVQETEIEEHRERTPARPECLPLGTAPEVNDGSEEYLATSKDTLVEGQPIKRGGDGADPSEGLPEKVNTHQDRGMGSLKTSRDERQKPSSIQGEGIPISGQTGGEQDPNEHPEGVDEQDQESSATIREDHVGEESAGHGDREPVAAARECSDGGVNQVKKRKMQTGQAGMDPVKKRRTENRVTK